MIIVTGTKRSGTSLWMQLLISAGYKHAGTKFPRNWEEKLKQANPRGFYESELRKGVYWETNPHPESGKYLHPKQTRKLLVKVFVPGLVRSDAAFLNRVVASIRPWREVVRSMRKMRAAEAKVFGWGKGDKVPVYAPPEIVWLKENFLLVRDLRVRAYPHLVVSHSQLMQSPQATLQGVMEFLGGPLDKVPAMAAQIDSKLHRNRSPQDVQTVIDPQTVALLDTFDRHVQAGDWGNIEGLTALNQAWSVALEKGWLDLKYRWDDPRVQGEEGAL